MAVGCGRSFSDGRELKQSCRECRFNAEKRAEWGCDGEAESLQLYIPCLDCLGEGCEACRGFGFEAIYRCPNSFNLADAFEYLRLQSAWPVLPFAGGLYDQPPIYIKVMGLLVRAGVLMQEALARAAEKEKESLK